MEAQWTSISFVDLTHSAYLHRRWDRRRRSYALMLAEIYA